MRSEPRVGQDAAPAAASRARDPTIRAITQRSRQRRRERRDTAGALGGPAWPIGRGPRPPVPWTQSRVIEAIRDWAGEMGGPPVPEEWGRKDRGPVSAGGLRWERERPRWPSAATVRARCGSWAEAIEKAGFTPSRPRPEGTCAERIEAAQRMAGAGHSAAVIADQLGVTASTVHRYLRPGRCRECGAPVVSSSTGYCLARRVQ
jgi:HNH endonuclease